MASLEIACTACGADALLRREPVYDGFKKTGERLLCSACGHEYLDEAEIPFRDAPSRPRVFGEEDRPHDLEVFADDERGRICRYCRHYVLNPFTQRCGLHEKFVEATDTCGDFHEQPSPPEGEGPPEEDAPAEDGRETDRTP